LSIWLSLIIRRAETRSLTVAAAATAERGNPLDCLVATIKPFKRATQMQAMSKRTFFLIIAIIMVELKK
jgi:hypothetical protein